MIDKLGGRKFVGFVFVSVLLFALTLTDKITGKEFVDFIIANFGIFVAGNVVTKFSIK
jgi:hypothetical protein